MDSTVGVNAGMQLSRLRMLCSASGIPGMGWVIDGCAVGMGYRAAAPGGVVVEVKSRDRFRPVGWLRSDYGRVDPD